MSQEVARAQRHGALDALCAIARFHQIAADPQTLAHRLGIGSDDDVDAATLLRAAARLGLRAKRSRSTVARLEQIPLPALAALRDPDGAERFVILARCDAQRVLLQDPALGGGSPVVEPIDTFAAHWTSEVILLTSRATVADALARFDFSWFIPSLVKYRRLLAEVLGIGFVLQLFALVSPLFFQVVMDKVLVHRGVTTLDVLVIGLVVVVVFESVLNGLRGLRLGQLQDAEHRQLGA
ncbi:MAG: cysteine peptidase family C39 domain-containing protein [Janthinobacterium lividum]